MPPRRTRSPAVPAAGWLLALALLLPHTAWSQGPLPSIPIGGHLYVSVADVAAALSARVDLVPLKDKVILRRTGAPDVVFTRLSPVYVIGRVRHRAPFPTRLVDGTLHVSRDVLVLLGLEAAAPTSPPSTDPVLPTVHRSPDGRVLKARWAIDRIAIDPGHGGRDPGALGSNRTREKDITLAVARRLGRRLRDDLGVDVVYTREKDVFVRLGDRARIARAAGADMFVSLHCNAGTRRAAGGIEVYFLSEAKTAAAAAVAERENAAIAFEEEPDTDDEDQGTLRGIARGILSSQYLKESQDLAASVRRSLVTRFRNLDDRGVKQANFYVMRGTMGVMPSILVEMGFISNPQEEKLMKKASFQKEMADAIFEGIRTFKEAHERQFQDR